MTLETYTLSILRRWRSIANTTANSTANSTANLTTANLTTAHIPVVTTPTTTQVLIPPLLQGRREQEENQGQVGTETDRGIPTPSSLQVPVPATSRGSSSSILRTQRSCRDTCKPSCRKGEEAAGKSGAMGKSIKQ